MLTYRRKMNLFKKIAVTAVSALALSGVSVITSAPANAAITGILSVDTVPNRSSSLSNGVASATAADNKVSVSMIALSDTSGASETVTVRGRIISNPTPATVDATTQITVGDTLVALATLSNNTAATVVLGGSDETVTVDSVSVLSNAFRTPGTYKILLWIDNVGNTIGGNSTIDGGEAYFTADVKVGGTPVSLETSSSSLVTAGDVSVDLGITLKDTNGIPTLLRNSLERITVSSTIAVGSTETLTVTKGKLTAPGSVLTTASRSGTPTTNTFLESTDSLTASTGSYDLHAKHTGSTSSTLTFNLGGILTPSVAKVVTFTTNPVATATKVALSSAIGVSTSTVKYVAPVAIETPTSTTYFASTSSASTLGWSISGTAGSIVNAKITSSSVAGITNGTYPVVIGTNGIGTYVTSATTASGSFTITVALATGNSVVTVTYTAPSVSQGALGTTGISTSLLSASITNSVVKSGDTTSLKINVKNNFDTPQQYYFVTGTLSSSSRNFGTTIATSVTDINGDATITFKDSSTSTTNFVDALTIQVTAPGTSTGLLTSANVLTVTYSATGSYASLTLTGGSTETVKVLKDVQATTAGTASAVTIATSLKNASGTSVSGVALVVTASDGVVLRTSAPTVRPLTGDLKTVTIGSGQEFTAIGTKPGLATVTVVGGGLTQTATFTVNDAVATTARNITLTTASGKVTATVKDGWGNPVKGISVNFAVDSKGIFGNGVTSTSAVTDANGNASAILQSFDGKLADAGIIASLVTIAQSADIADTPVTGFAKGESTAIATVSLPAVNVIDSVASVKVDVATANAAVKALATQVTVLQASVATLIDSLTTQIASLMKSVSALTKAVAKLQKK
jgi:hypothetical protein